MPMLAVTTVQVEKGTLTEQGMWVNPGSAQKVKILIM